MAHSGMLGYDRGRRRGEIAVCWYACLSGSVEYGLCCRVLLMSFRETRYLNSGWEFAKTQTLSINCPTSRICRNERVENWDIYLWKLRISLIIYILLFIYTIHCSFTHFDWCLITELTLVLGLEALYVSLICRTGSSGQWNKSPPRRDEQTASTPIHTSVPINTFSIHLLPGAIYGFRVALPWRVGISMSDTAKRMLATQYPMVAIDILCSLCHRSGSVSVLLYPALFAQPTRGLRFRQSLFVY